MSSELGCLQWNKLITAPKTDMLILHPLDSQEWLVLQKGSITRREGASPDPSLFILLSWKTLCEKREISTQRYPLYISTGGFLPAQLQLWSIYFTSQNYKIQIHSAYRFQNRIENKQFIFHARQSSRETAAKIDYGLQGVLVVRI